MADTTLVTPFWFPQRQLKADEAGENCFRIGGPNMPDSFLGVRQLDDGQWEGFFRHDEDGDEETVTGMKFDAAYNAWEGAFELYREKMIL